MELIAKKRTELGKKSKKLIRSKQIPAVVFAKGMSSEPVTLDFAQFEKVYKAAGESTLVDIKVEGSQPVKVLFSEVARHPITGRITHANLHKVNLKEKISATVPIEIVGESPIVKSGEGLLLVLLNEVTVEALPTDLPHDIKVDISGLVELNQGITVKELPIDHSKVVIEQGADDLVVKIDYAEMKEEEVPAEVTEAELVAKVETTEQLSDEEKAKREAEKKEKEDKGDKHEKEEKK